MSRVTRFAARDPGPSARVAGFIAHLRANGLRLGVAETQTALAALSHVSACDPSEARRALKCVCAGDAREAARFDGLFDAYWMNGGRVRPRAAPVMRKGTAQTGETRPPAAADRSATGGAQASGDGGADAPGDGTGRLVAAHGESLLRRDLRGLVSPQEIREAEAIARRLAQALADRRSRRHRSAPKGERLHFRRILRLSLATGGEPLRLPRRRRPDRPPRLVALCDVSGSMSVHARVFLAFLAGLLRADGRADAWLFHTRLLHVADALRDPDPRRALDRLTLLSDGFGGGSRIGASLAEFARGPARRAVNGRTVTLVFSDGYDTGPAEDLAAALARLRRRGGRIVWLNPLKGWREYAPVARGMAAALPYLDLFAAASTLGDLADLVPRLERL